MKIIVKNVNHTHAIVVNKKCSILGVPACGDTSMNWIIPV